MTDATQASEHLRTPPNTSEHLRVIRSLMEKSTIYRTVSAQAALAAGGLASLSGVAVVAGFWQPDITGFYLGWVAVLIISCVVNAVFLKRQSSEEGEPLLSSRLQHALLAICPTVILTALFTVNHFYAYRPLIELTCGWMLLYGVCLLSTSDFAPSSIRRLGFAFITGGVATASLPVILGEAPCDQADVALPSLLMVLIFGLFHLIYGGVTLYRSGSDESDD